MKKDDKIVESLVTGGIIGAGLGALLSKDKKKGAKLGAIAGAVFLATLEANAEAIKTNIPVLIEDDGYLWEVNANGERKKIKKIEKSKILVQKHFQLK